jgi:hypothetical protein
MTSAAFPFHESPQLGVWTTQQIMDLEEPILLVSHEQNGDWQFLPGRAVDVAEGVALHLAHVVERHPEVHELADLPRGWGAERDSPDVPWRRFPLDPES